MRAFRGVPGHTLCLFRHAFARFPPPPPHASEVFTSGGRVKSPRKALSFLLDLSTFHRRTFDQAKRPSISSDDTCGARGHMGTRFFELVQRARGKQGWSFLGARHTKNWGPISSWACLFFEVGPWTFKPRQRGGPTP